uniref:Transmembrane protein 14A n=1 Tax=Nothobranchius furzeri TaxID=105023 RepID=A0A8C6MEQ5_NOTFU
MDWIGFGYAAAIFFGGFLGYKRRGSVMSLIAGFVFGGLSALGAYNISNDPKNILVSLIASGVLSVIMGMRYKKSGKLMPAGIISGLRSESLQNMTGELLLKHQSAFEQQHICKA